MNLPTYIPLIFILITALTLYLFLKAVKYSKLETFSILSIWLALQGSLGYIGFYMVIETEPVRFFLALPLAFLYITVLFISKKRRKWIEDLDFKTLTLIHVVRIPVELVLYGLFVNETVPELMTFSGRNFDILAGITAPFVYYFGFVKNKIGRIGILLWNCICLFLLLNIVVNAILSAPMPFQQFAFDQPNTALLYFPFIWLPTFIVPIVLFSHLVTIKRVVSKMTS